MKKKILVIVALIIAISVLCCTVAVAEELPTEQTGESVTVPEESVEETPEETPSQDITDKIAAAGDKALEWANVAVGGVSGLVGIIVTFLLGLVGAKMKQNLLKTKEQNADISALKTSFNDMVDEMNVLKEILDAIKSENGGALSAIIAKLKTTDGKNDALCKTLATLINYSNLPDASKENILGEMNAALGYTKSEVTTDEKVD